MKENQIIFYNTTVGEALEMLEMESRRDNALINFDEFEVKLNKKGDSVLVTLVRSIDGMSIREGLIQLKVDFPGKFRDMESIDRVQAVLALNPNSDWWKGILEYLEHGEPLGYRVEEILIDTEERIEDPDQEILMKLNELIAMQPTNRFYRSLYDQLMGGRELSERQLEVIDEKLDAVQMVGNQPNNQLVRIEEALELDPRNRFLAQLKSKAEDRIQLSERQMNVVEEIIASQSSPESKLLADLKSNVNLSRDDFMLINKGQRRGIDSLNDEERKRLRHLIYRNERRLNNSYSKDEVRRLLKKGNTMRKSASEVIRNLEMRIARLEGNLNRTARMTREAAGKPQLEGVRSGTAYHDGRSIADATSCMLYLIGESENKSKFYEMVINGSTVEILYGRLGSTGRSSDKSFMDSYDAEMFFAKQLKSKLKKGYVSAFSQRGEHRKSGPLYGKYPIGLTSTPGPWQNQDIAYAQGMITDTISVIRAAITSFNEDGIVDERAVAQLMSTQRSLSTNRDQLSQESASEIKLVLDRIQGTGRAGRQPIEVRTRNAIKSLQKLMRKLDGAMTGGRRRASLRRNKKKGW
jgi:predicted DNA-binding WGR domain protein